MLTTSFPYLCSSSITILVLSSKQHTLFNGRWQAPLIANNLSSHFTLGFIFISYLYPRFSRLFFPDYPIQQLPPVSPPLLSTCQSSLQTACFTFHPCFGRSGSTQPSPMNCHVPFFHCISSCCDYYCNFICKFKICFHQEVFFLLTSVILSLHQSQKALSPHDQHCLNETRSRYHGLPFKESQGLQY